MRSSLPNLTKKRVGLEVGDSGSIVVDAGSDMIYGLVIGANPMAEIYISPFVDIMNQVQCYFPHARISLPEPELSSIAESHQSFRQLSVEWPYSPRFPFAPMSAGRH